MTLKKQLILATLISAGAFFALAAAITLLYFLMENGMAHLLGK